MFWVRGVDRMAHRRFFSPKLGLGRSGRGREREREIEGFLDKKLDARFYFSYRIGFSGGLASFIRNQT